MEAPRSFGVCVTAGAGAGFFADLALFPLDTIKTRLQSPGGFIKSGGFNGVYRGLSSCLAGSMPSAAAFFGTYETSKNSILRQLPSERWAPMAHMTAASLGEVASCSLRVPFEVVKQNVQANVYKDVNSAVRIIFRDQGLRGFYAGYLSTCIREVPFSLIQFPIYEYFKVKLAEYYHRSISPVEVALCGSVAGGISAAVTCPLDVAKTRIMLSGCDNRVIMEASARNHWTVRATLLRVYREEGMGKLFAGLGPRVTWISIGGAVFFGMYESLGRFISENL